MHCIEHCILHCIDCLPCQFPHHPVPSLPKPSLAISIQAHSTNYCLHTLISYLYPAHFSQPIKKGFSDIKFDLFGLFTNIVSTMISYLYPAYQLQVKREHLFHFFILAEFHQMSFVFQKRILDLPQGGVCTNVISFPCLKQIFREQSL